MAKKGGVQQLQADINTDEEFEKFLERSGLLVMDVYTEWCGPCLGMVGSLKKIKLELGGDNLQLAICKANYITALQRFRNKSEPTWLFASHGKAVNIMFGTNVPKLMKLIAQELKLEQEYVSRKSERKFYEITEMQPIELERYNLVKAAEDAARLAEIQEAENKRRQYLLFVTDEIMRNMPDMGVTIFGPHIVRDMYKKLMEPADAQKLSCKDRRILQITKEDLEILHFSCNNRLPDEVWEHMLGKDILTCLWKVSDSDPRPVEDVLALYVQDCVKPQQIIDDFGNVVPDKMKPPLLPPLEIKITPVGVVSGIDEVVAEPQAEESTGLAGLLGDMSMLEGENLEEEEEEVDEAEKLLMPVHTTEEVQKTLESKENIQTITIPAVWSPGNHRTMAAAIYVFYRWHTGTFLPPDPVAEPPHLVIAFEAYKRKDITEVIERFQDDVLAYGYFTSDDADTAELITNSTKYYDTKVPQVSDKLVIKVSKKTSHALLTLAAHGPSYISTNAVTGAKESKKFFPEGYKTEGDASLADQKKSKKKKKLEQKPEQVVVETPQVDTVEEEEEGIAPDQPEETEGVVSGEAELDIFAIDDEAAMALVPPDAETEPPPIPDAQAPESTENPSPAPQPSDSPDQKEAPTQENQSVPGNETQDQKADAAPTEQAAEPAPAEQAAVPAPAEQAAEPAPAEQAVEAAPTEQAAEAAPAEQAAEAAPAPPEEQGE